MSAKNKEGASVTASPTIDAAAEERKRKRQERNRESARESRRRKRDKTDTLRSQLARLEAENLQLRLQLKESSEGGDAAPRAKNTLDAASTLEGMVAGGSSDAEIMAALQKIQEQHADYGANHKSAVNFHISQLRQCLLPTQITQTVLWMNKCATYFRSQQGSASEPVALESLPPEVQEAGRLFTELAEAMRLSEEQRQHMYGVTFFSRMEEVASRCSALVDRLEHLVSFKNESLDSEMRLLQQTLNPSQVLYSKILIHVVTFILSSHNFFAGR